MDCPWYIFCDGDSAECEERDTGKEYRDSNRKSTFERSENVEGIFKLCDVACFQGKHVLIIDDVLTTGSTTVACASTLFEVEGGRISVLTLAVAE